MKVVLEILQGGLPGHKVTLDEGRRVYAGRAGDCDIQLLDRGVSRRHLSVYIEAGEPYVEDLNSSNGTYLNSRRIRKARLDDGDLIRVGLAAIRVRLERAGAAAPAAKPEEDTVTVTPVDDVFGTRIRRRVDLDRSMLLAADLDAAALRRAHRNLATLYKLTSELQGASDVDALAGRLVNTLRKGLDGDKVALVMVSHTGRPVLAAAAGAAEGFFPPASIVEEVISSGLSTLVRDIQSDERYRGLGVSPSTSSIMCAPIVAAGEVLGALYAESSAGTPFDEVSLELLAAVGSQVGMLAHRLRLGREKEDLFFSSVRALAGAVDAKDHYTKGHSERVTAYAVRLARHVGMSQEETETIQLSAILHDIGKIGVPEGILNKPGPLTDEELMLVREHPVRGREIVAAIKSPVIPHVLEGVLHHHERWDGSGYPDGLAGLDIPLVGRILALADAFDAMTTDRPYREAYPAEYAVSLVGEGAGSQFDPELAGKFLDLYYAGRLLIPSRRERHDTPAPRGKPTPPPFRIKAT